MRALILVDIQNDFLPGGALAVKDADEVVEVANALMSQFDLVVGVRDWHPPGHVSFAASHQKRPGETILVEGSPQILWPIHCVRGTHGADFPKALHAKKLEAIFNKGTDPRIDSYGAFFDNNRKRSTGLDGYLKERGVKHIYVAGLTTEYCVKATVLDGLRLGFEVTVVVDGIRAVNLLPGDGEKAIDEMRAAGATCANWEELSSRIQ